MLGPRYIPLACFILAFCSLNYEFLLAQMMSILGGHTVFFYSLTIGLYIFALGLGAIIQVEDLAPGKVQSRLFAAEISLCILGGGAPFWMIGVDSLCRGHAGTTAAALYLAALPHALFVLIVGFLSGMEMPLLLRLAQIQGLRNLITRLFAVDYLASFAGAVSFPLFLFPQLGVVRSASVLALLNLGAVFIAVPVDGKRWRVYMTAALASLVAFVLCRSAPFEAWLSRALYD